MTLGWRARRSASVIAFRCARSSRSASVLAPRTARNASRVPGVAPDELAGLPQRRQQVRVAHGDDAAEQVRVSTDELRHRLHGHVGPERQWTLIERRSEGVVHAQDRATLPRCSADGVQVSDRQQRVRRRLQPNQVGHAANLDPAWRCRPPRRDARSTGRGFGRLWRVPRHPGSSRPAGPRPSLRGVDRRSQRSRPCRRRRRPKSLLRGRQRSLRAPPIPACRRRESTHGDSPSTKFDAGHGGTLSGEPGRRSRPAETSHDSTELESPAVCSVVSLDIIPPLSRPPSPEGQPDQPSLMIGREQGGPPWR